MLDVRTQDPPFGGAPPLVELAEPRTRRKSDAASNHRGAELARLPAAELSGAERQTAVWGWLPELSLVSSFAVLLLALTNAGAYRGAGWAEPLFWCALLLLYAPIVVRLTAQDAARRERIGLVLLAVVAFYVVKIVHSPYVFTFADELVHAFNAESILRTHALFGPNSVLRASPLYPGLESVTAALVAVSGTPLFVGGLIVAGAARVVLALAVFLCYEQVSGSPRVAGLGAAIYMAQPNFLFWSAQFSYETLSLPLAIVVIYLVARRQQEPDLARSRGYLALVLLIGLALVPTHHLTVYVLVLLLLAWGLVERFGLHRWTLRQLDRLTKLWTTRQPRRRTRRSRRRASTAQALPASRFGPGLLGVILLAAALLWLGLVASPTVGYLAPVFGKAATSLVSMIAGEQTGRQLFVSTGGTVAPLWERAAGIGSVLVSAAGLPLGLWQLWRRYSVSALAFVLAGAAIGFFAVLPLRLNAQAWEIANRASGYLFLGLAFVLALAAAGIGHASGPRWPARTALTLAAFVMFAGGVISGWAPALRLARPVFVEANGRTFTPSTWTTTDWASAHLEPKSVYAADEANGRVLLMQGNQRVYAGRYPAIPQLLQDPDIADWVLESLQQRRIRYVVIDQRRSAWDPMAGYFYDPQPGSLPVVPEYFDAEQTAKFDRLPVDRVYDAGTVVIYDVKELRDARLPSRLLLVFITVELVAGLLGLLAAVFPAVRVMPAALLLLMLPGFTLAAALFPRARLGWAERLLLALAGSMALLIVAALLLNLTPWGLRTATWVVAVAGITLAAGAVALVRRRQAAPSCADLERRLALLGRRTTGLPWRLTLPQAAMFTLAAVLLGLAVFVARTPASGAAYAGYTQLWMLPAAQGQPIVTLGVTSQEFTPATYRLDLMAGDKLVRSWPDLVLQPQATWQATATVPATVARSAKLEAKLYRTDAGGGALGTVYRHVLLRPLGAPEELATQ